MPFGPAGRSLGASSRSSPAKNRCFTENAQSTRPPSRAKGVVAARARRSGTAQERVFHGNVRAIRRASSGERTDVSRRTSGAVTGRD
jgi:hypothetical protein